MKKNNMLTKLTRIPIVVFALELLFWGCAIPAMFWVGWHGGQWCMDVLIYAFVPEFHPFEWRTWGNFWKTYAPVLGFLFGIFCAFVVCYLMTRFVRPLFLLEPQTHEDWFGENFIQRIKEAFFS